MRTIQREIVGAVLLSRDDKVLLGKTARDAGGVYSGSWVIQGGGIEPGETRQQAIIREVKEETHHDISNLPMELIDDTATGESEKVLKETGERVLVKMRFIEFKIIFPESANTLGTEPTTELVELKWFSSGELKYATIASPTRELLRRMKLLYD